ncbi:MAG: ABC transporter ATP-binding protein [Proteobacteria bacterium]|nr:ABC transporter ATP-binding protein [Pseudomonadota bacterium]
MQRLQVKNINVSYGKKQVVFDVSLDLGNGEIGCLLGPSGCGKTTVLRSIAGFEPLVKGEILINDKVISSQQVHLPPEQRKIGMVFQDFALFPHLNVNDNIRFGIQSWSAEKQKQRAAELLAMIDMADFGNAYSHQLSGGQQQRVALARAMAPKPSILLLDEPFSSMDVELREQLAREVRQILKRENITAILVTHDQHEAFSMADEICVLHQGRVQQYDSAYNLYHQPNNRFVADFIGEGVFIPGEVVSDDTVSTELGDLQGFVPKGCEPGCLVDVLIRPDDIVHNDSANQTATVVARAFRGAEFLYTLKMPSGVEVLSLVPSHHKHQINEQIGIQLEFNHLVIFTRTG